MNMQMFGMKNKGKSKRETDSLIINSMDKTEIIASVEAENNGKVYTTKLFAGDRTYIADEPKIFGGNDEGAAPAQYICMALRMYANRKK